MKIDLDRYEALIVLELLEKEQIKLEAKCKDESISVAILQGMKSQKIYNSSELDVIISQMDDLLKAYRYRQYCVDELIKVLNGERPIKDLMGIKQDESNV